MAPVIRPNTRVSINAKKPVISAENIIAGKNISFSKRKAESSPPTNGTFKRPALNEITNDGKTAKVKNLLKTGKSLESNGDVTAKNSTVTKPRLRSNNVVTGIRVQGLFKRSNVNPHPSESYLKSTESFKSKCTNKPLPRTSIVTRASLSSKSVINNEKAVNANKNQLKKFVSEACTINHDCTELNAEKLNSIKPSIQLPKLKAEVHNTAIQNVENIKTSIRPSLRSYVENNEVSVQSLVPISEKEKKSSSPSEPHEESIRVLRRSLRNVEKSEYSARTSNQIGQENVAEEPVAKLRRSSRHVAEKIDTLGRIANNVSFERECETNDEVVLEPSVKLRRSLRINPEKMEISYQSSAKIQVAESDSKVSRRSSTRLSLRKSLPEDRSTENGSLYVSALEDINISMNEAENDPKHKKYYELSEFDKELLHDPQQVSLYAMEIFDYLKSREAHFPILDYMSRQPYIDKKMRAMLVDWMVEVQENFELNHETLYLSIKLLDSYLSHFEIRKESLQLLGAAALFLSCKYDERLSPLIDEFEYVGDGAYDKTRLLTMEQNILRSVNFELSFPISYSFLRRYARCARIQMPLLTLARYILEVCLMEYDTITLSDSKQAAAALYLAFRMKKHSSWTDSLKYYTGYDVSDFKDIVLLLNRILHQKPSSQLMTIRNKYSHELFFQVALTPLLSDKDLNLNA